MNKAFTAITALKAPNICSGYRSAKNLVWHINKIHSRKIIINKNKLLNRSCVQLDLELLGLELPTNQSHLISPYSGGSRVFPRSR